MSYYFHMLISMPKKTVHLIRLSSNSKRFWTGKDFSSFVREAAEVDRNRCDGVDEGYAALRVAPDGVPGIVKWDESDGDDMILCL